MVGESIGAVVALTVASEIPERIKAVFAFNPYDYEMRYGDGIWKQHVKTDDPALK